VRLVLGRRDRQIAVSMGREWWQLEGLYDDGVRKNLSTRKKRASGNCNLGDGGEKKTKKNFHPENGQKGIRERGLTIQGGRSQLNNLYRMTKRGGAAVTARKGEGIGRVASGCKRGFNVITRRVRLQPQGMRRGGARGRMLTLNFRYGRRPAAASLGGR